MMRVISIPEYRERRNELPSLDDVLGGRTKYQLMDRDIDILEALYLRRFLTTRQLWQEFFGGESETNSHRSCQIRLAKLYALGFVDRFRPPAEQKDGTNPYVYVIDKLGFELLKHLRGDRGVTRWDFKDKIPEMSKVWHELELNGFCLRLVLAAKERGLDPVWYTSRQSVQRIAGDSTKEGPLYQPDAIIQWVRPDGSPMVIHVEYERTADQRWFLEKLRNWRLYRSRTMWKKKGYYAEPKILVVGRRVATRTHGSILALRTAAKAHEFDGIFFLATEDMERNQHPLPPEDWPVFTSRDVEGPNPDPTDRAHPTIECWEQTQIWTLREQSPWARPTSEHEEDDAS